MDKEFKLFFSKYPQTKILFIHNQEFKQDFHNMYLEYDFVPLTHKNKITIHGKGAPSLILHQNSKYLKHFFQTSLQN